MINSLNLFVVLIVLLLTSFSGAQSTEIKINENDYVEICGRMLMIDGIWMSEGIIKADISILESPNSKPITGGYKKGDEITISSKEGCTYYVFSVSKSGINDSKGTVVLSKNIPLSSVPVCEDSLTFFETRGYKIDSLDWVVAAIKIGDGGKLEAEIYVTYKTSLISGLFLKENDYLWLGECLYRISELNKPFLTYSDKTRIPLDGSLKLIRISDYFYENGKIIKGEEINKPIEHIK